MTLVLLRAGLAAVLLLAASAAHAQSERSAGELMDAVMWGKEPIGGSFALNDHTGKPRTDAEFRGKLMLVYFGFSFCPDVCPTDLMAIGQAIDKLGSDGDGVQPLFITVDLSDGPRREISWLLSPGHTSGPHGRRHQTSPCGWPLSVITRAARQTANTVGDPGPIDEAGLRGLIMALLAWPRKRKGAGVIAAA